MSFLQILSNDGSLLAAIGAVMAVMLAGIGSAYGVARAGQAGTRDYRGSPRCIWLCTGASASSRYPGNLWPAHRLCNRFQSGAAGRQ